MNYLQATAAAISDLLPNEILPDADVDQLLLLYAVLARAKGMAVTTEDVHDAWVAWMTVSNPQHRSLRPYRDLDEQTRSQDEPFVAAIHRVAMGMSVARGVA